MHRRKKNRRAQFHNKIGANELRMIAQSLGPRNRCSLQVVYPRMLANFKKNQNEAVKKLQAKARGRTIKKRYQIYKHRHSANSNGKSVGSIFESPRHYLMTGYPSREV